MMTAASAASSSARQPPRRGALWTVVKPLQSLCIVTNNRVAKRLAIHPRKPRGISPGHLLQSIRDPIGPRRRSTVRSHASPAPKRSMNVQILICR